MQSGATSDGAAILSRPPARRHLQFLLSPAQPVAPFSIRAPRPPRGAASRPHAIASRPGSARSAYPLPRPSGPSAYARQRPRALRFRPRRQFSRLSCRGPAAPLPVHSAAPAPLGSAPLPPSLLLVARLGCFLTLPPAPDPPPSRPSPWPKIGAEPSAFPTQVHRVMTWPSTACDLGDRLETTAVRRAHRDTHPPSKRPAFPAQPAPDPRPAPDCIPAPEPAPIRAPKCYREPHFGTAAQL